VTATYKGKTSILSASWVMPVSHEPPLVALAVNPANFTYELIDGSEEFAVNIPTGDLVKQVKYCGSVSGREVDKFKATGLHPLQAAKVSAPLIEECVGHLECGVRDRVVAGDHVMFIGEILAAAVEVGAFEGVWLVEKEEAKILHHLGGSTYFVPKGRFDV
jgi:flavin reductase (DIM6/NTAB) family NADH-FMN oxidoreductase RutF